MRFHDTALLRRAFGLKAILVFLAVFVSCMLFTRLTVAHYLDIESERLLSNAQKDLKRTYDSTVDYALSYIANAIIDELQTVKPLGAEEMRRLARVYGVDEINLADTRGVWVASTEDGIVGVRLAGDPRTAEYLELLKSDVSHVVQPFRTSVSNPELCRKYLGMSFDDNSGLIQLGLDARRAVADYERTYDNFVTGWFVDDVRYYVVARGDGTLIECGRTPSTDAKTLAEIGYDIHATAADSAKTFRQTLFGESCRCRETNYYDYRFIAVLPDSYFKDFVNLTMNLVRLILLFTFAIIAIIRLNVEHRRMDSHARNVANARRRKEDLNMARSIQRSALPAVFPPYPRDLTMDIFASMDPAKDVGGDFYDFHYVGADRLAFLVADVSGKGVPAAMFMMKAKTILQALTMSVADLSDAVSAANDHLCEGNEADMFVTCWLGILDERTGLLRYVNAGHNPPYICRSKDRRIEELASVSGLFLGGIPDQRYKTFETHLEPGDMLFLYTDGVTEANNRLGAMFGESRLLEVLKGERGLGLARLLPVGIARPSPREICRRVRAAVDGFAGSEAQFDDITMLALRYRGWPHVVDKTVQADLASVPLLNAFAESELDRVKCPPSVKADMLVALDEVSNNVASYSGGREMTLVVETATDPSVVRMRILDDGVPWNPLDHLDPDVTLSVDERAIGGLGILMVKRLMDDVSYVRRDGRNQFSFRKSFEVKS